MQETQESNSAQEKIILMGWSVTFYNTTSTFQSLKKNALDGHFWTW